MAEQTLERLVETMKKAARALCDAGIPFAVGGGIAIWARGGPGTGHDVDIFVKPSDAERALGVLAEGGFRTERPPEGWLLKAYDGEVLVDLIFEPADGPVDDGLLERAQDVEVMAMEVPLISLEDVLVQKLHALSEQEPDFTDELEIARSLREQIDWGEVRKRTADSPFAKAFFTLVEELGVVPQK